jgi:hypothetical protein
VISLGLPWSAFEGIGWSKLRMIAPVLTSENHAVWVALAKKMTQIALLDHVKKHLEAQEKGEPAPEPEQSKITSMTFQVHADQRETIETAIDLAKKQSKTDYAAVALEYICLAYLNHPAAEKPKKKGVVAVDATLEDAVKSVLLMVRQSTQNPKQACELVLGLFERVFPEVDLHEVTFAEVFAEVDLGSV